MNLEQWRPFGSLTSLHDRINRLFQDEFDKDVDRGGAVSTWYPSTDIYETKDDYVFKLEVPGLAKEDVKVEFKDNTLVISGEKKETKEVKKENYHRVESFSGMFTRSFVLPKDTDHSKIDASMKDGILELKVPKSEEKKAKAISINVK